MCLAGIGLNKKKLWYKNEEREKKLYVVFSPNHFKSCDRI